MPAEIEIYNETEQLSSWVDVQQNLLQCVNLSKSATKSDFAEAHGFLKWVRS